MLGWKVIPRFGAGGAGISPHGLFIAAGYFLGASMMARRGRERGVDEGHLWNVAAWGVVGAILGARIAYIAGHADDFSSPLEWLQIWKGGISLMGGFLGGIGLAWRYIRKNGLDFFQVADLGATGLAAGTALGRIGDLVIGDHLGKETSGPWAWVYRGGELISPPPCHDGAGNPVYSTPDGCIVPGTAVHQTALYDGLWSLVIFGILLLADRRQPRRGFLFLSWAGLYAAGRIVTDFLRVDKRWVLGLTGSQLTALAALVVCGYLLARYRGAPGRAPEPVLEGVEEAGAAADAPAADAPPGETEPAAASTPPEPHPPPPEPPELTGGPSGEEEHALPANPPDR